MGVAARRRCRARGRSDQRAALVDENRGLATGNRSATGKSARRLRRSAEQFLVDGLRRRQERLARGLVGEQHRQNVDRLEDRAIRAKTKTPSRKAERRLFFEQKKFAAYLAAGCFFFWNCL